MHRCAPWRWLVLVFATLVITSNAVSQVASTGLGSWSRSAQAITLPQDPADTKSFTIDFDWSDPFDAGYFAAEVSIRSTSVFAADQNVVLRIEPIELGHSPPQNGLSIDLPISAKQGTRVQTVVRQIPKWSVGSGYRLRVFAEGTELENYQAEIGQLFASTNRITPHALAREHRLDFLSVVDIEDLDSAPRNVLWKCPTAKYPRQSVRRRNGTVFDNPRRDIRRLADMPTDWRHFQKHDIVSISQSSLELLQQNQPDQHQALRDWLLMGGGVLVWEADSMEAAVDAIGVKYSPKDSAANVIPILVNQSVDDYRSIENSLKEGIKFKRRFESMDEKSRAFASLNDDEYIFLSQRYDKNTDYAALLKRHQATKPDTALVNEVWIQIAGAGRVLAIAKGQSLTTADWNLIKDSIDWSRSPMIRRGVDPIVGDRRANRWLIPGVAQPPVYTFISLLTLFVILVGPIAYRITSKSDRTYLMFAIAPLLALLTTAALLIYGVLADGFQTHVRIRQLTWIDGNSGDAVERTRATYFAGLRPKSGLRFDPLAEVMRYPANEEDSWEDLNELEHSTLASVTITEKEQRFGGTLLPSRAQRQFVTHQPRHGVGRLTIADRRTPKSRFVDSTLDFALRSVLIRDSTGMYWQSESIGANETGVEFAPCRDPGKLLGEMYTQHQLVSASTTSRSNRGYSRTTRDLIASVSNTNSPSVMLTDGYIESWLHEQLLIESDLPPDHFIGLSDVSDDVIAVDGAKPTHSVRYVFGTLP